MNNMNDNNIMNIPVRKCITIKNKHVGYILHAVPLLIIILCINYIRELPSKFSTIIIVLFLIYQISISFILIIFSDILTLWLYQHGYCDVDELRDIVAARQLISRQNIEINIIICIDIVMDANSNIFVNVDDSECIICYEQEKCCITKCGHIFGRKCIASWLKENNSCPLCRSALL